jgi:hypothetical protein
MSRIDRRTFLQAALSVGAAAWGNAVAHASRVAWREQRTMFPEGVASGDPMSLYSQCSNERCSGEFQIHCKSPSTRLWCFLILARLAQQTPQNLPA